MKKALNISALYIGLVIGAGFASGREILEYFNLKNQRDLSGIILAAVLFSFIAYIILIRAKENSTSDFYEFVSQTSGKFGYYIRKFMFLYMFTSFFVMLSAGGSLISLSLGIEKKFAIALMSLFCFFVLIFGTKGIEILNGILVPFMICGIITLCVFSVIGKTAPTVNLISEAKNNFLISALCYASYNTINAGAVLVPASEGASKKEIVLSSAISGGTLGILIFAVWITLNLYFNEVISSDFPLLDIAFLSGSIFKSAYSAVLFMAICTTAASSGYGVISAFDPQKNRDRIFPSIIICLLAAPLAAFGFSALVANVYSLFGFLGLFWLIILIKSFIVK